MNRYCLLTGSELAGMLRTGVLVRLNVAGQKPVAFPTVTSAQDQVKEKACEVRLSGSYEVEASMRFTTLTIA